MERIVLDFERSGLSRRAYSERHGIAVPTLDWYRRRMRVGRGEAKLVPVRVAKPSAGSAEETARDSGRGFTLVLNNGSRIETGWNFNDEAMRRLIRIAGAA